MYCRRNGVFAESAAKKHGRTVDRKNWRVLLSWHIAETREKAVAEAREGLLRHHNEYIVGTLQRPGASPFNDPDEAIEKTAFAEGAAATIGTPDDLVARIKSVLEVSGGFGTLGRQPLLPRPPPTPTTRNRRAPPLVIPSANPVLSESCEEERRRHEGHHRQSRNNPARHRRLSRPRHGAGRRRLRFTQPG